MIAGKGRAQGKEKLELQMTSMIDVVFLLLIFFIVTLAIPKEEAMIVTTLRGLEEPGPGPLPPVPPKEFDDVVLLITRDEFGGVKRYMRNTPMLNDGMLLSYMRGFRELYPDGRVIIQCTDKVPYKELVSTIGLAQVADLKIGFADLH